MITDIRLLSQQLINPTYNSPTELVKWMGALQAQNYEMSKWAIGIRLKSCNLNSIDEALLQGKIIRMHIMRPTWHFVAAEDVRWMLQLSSKRIRSANESFGKQWNITEKTYSRCNRLIEKALEEYQNMTKQEIGTVLKNYGIPTDIHLLSRYVTRAETEGIICSGIDKNGKPTYALLNKRIPPTKALHHDEALSKLATAYFRSHSPASLQDFVWWSGLTITEARKAISNIEHDLIQDKKLYIHNTYTITQTIKSKNILHLLPPFDEYLISYKDRTSVIETQHHSKAFNTFGTFYPVILYNGKIIGNWNRPPKGKTTIETSFFDPNISINRTLLETAKKRYLTVMNFIR